MYELMVSYNCGSTYISEKWVEDPAELDTRCDELDAQGLRWVIEDGSSGKPVYRACAIHREIIIFMERAKSMLEVTDED